MRLQGKITRLADVETRRGRMGDYQTQVVMLDLTGGDGLRQSLFGTLFGTSIDALSATGARVGDTVEVDVLFTTSERNGFVSNYVELRNPRKL